MYPGRTESRQVSPLVLGLGDLRAMIQTMHHFREPERIDPVTSADRLPAEVYNTALDHLVIACVDIVFTCQNQVLLVKRNRYPRLSWWIIGGRMVAGEDPKQTAIRKAAQELGIEGLSADRLQYLGCYSTCFAFRHQAPQHHGSHTLNLTYRTELTALEQESILLCPDEHQTWQWFKLDEVICWLDTDQIMDRALLRVMQDLRDCLN